MCSGGLASMGLAVATILVALALHLPELFLLAGVYGATGLFLFLPSALFSSP